MPLSAKHSFQIIGTSLWCGLGFCRGLNSYKYSHAKEENKESFLYIHFLGCGLFGTFLYANPFFFPLALHKEMYRLEVNVRHLEEEKKSNYYNHLV